MIRAGQRLEIVGPAAGTSQNPRQSWLISQHSKEVAGLGEMPTGFLGKKENFCILRET